MSLIYCLVRNSKECFQREINEIHEDIDRYLNGIRNLFTSRVRKSTERSHTKKKSTRTLKNALPKGPRKRQPLQQ